MHSLKDYKVKDSNLIKLNAKMELCRRDPVRFFNFICGFEAQDYQKQIIQSVLDMQPDDTLIISCPPRHGKTQVISKILPIWLMGNALNNNETLKYGIFTYGQKYSNDISIETRNYINSPYYGFVFPNVKLSSESIEKWRVDSPDSEISYMVSSVGGVATGLGFNYIVIDDPIRDWEEARSRDRTEKLYNWYQSVASTRREKGCKTIIIATRWSDHDLTGRLASNGHKVINFKAIDNGKALWQSRFSLEHLESIKVDMPSKVWSCLYQGMPIPDEGLLIKPEWIKYKHFERKPSHSLIAWDTASKIEDPNDWSVGIELNKDELGNIYIIDMIRVKQEFPDLVRTINNWGTSDNVYIEDKSSGIQLIQTLRRECKRNIIPIKTNKSKISRVEAITPLFETGRVYINDEYNFNELIKELLQFPDGNNDDCVDALTHALDKINIATKATSGANRDSARQNSIYSKLF